MKKRVRFHLHRPQLFNSSYSHSTRFIILLFVLLIQFVASAALATRLLCSWQRLNCVRNEWADVVCWRDKLLT